jgi:hypothetical protein
MPTTFAGQALDRGFRDEPAGPQQRRVRDVIAAGTPAVDVTSHEHDAVRTLERAGVPGSALVLVLHERGREVRPHPSDVVGWTTLEDLRAAPTVAAAANGSHVLLGAGLTVSAALERAARTRPGWDVGLVLEDGRVAAAVRRAQVETPNET